MCYNREALEAARKRNGELYDKFSHMNEQFSRLLGISEKILEFPTNLHELGEYYYMFKEAVYDSRAFYEELTKEE
jgi:hypothetical protein